MDASLQIAVFYYDGAYYLPTVVRSVDGVVGIDDQIVVVPAGDRAKLAEEIELKAVAGNPTLTRADFRATSDNSLITLLRFPNRQAFFTNTRRWSITERDGQYQLIPFKPASFRGVIEDYDRAESLNPATFANEAAERISSQVADR